MDGKQFSGTGQQKSRPEQTSSAQSQNNSSQNTLVTAPAIELPKGGGAIRAIGEKFAANPVTGTGSMSVPIATSPGRSGFGPQLALSYNSGSGNSPFGFGWNLALAAITRKTDKGLPQYQDAVESDVFVLSGAEDLVPELNLEGEKLVLQSADSAFIIHRYRPRIEGLFARIERWTQKKTGDVHWRSISKENILTIYGKDKNSRIADPEAPECVFSWLICETRDDKGNAVVYEYKSEDGVSVDLDCPNERNRGAVDDLRRTANRYIKRIFYGNDKPLLINGQRPEFIDNIAVPFNWMFEVVFDYGEHHENHPQPDDNEPWGFRKDAFSNYRSGFEIRTTRLCQRVLMFHHFPSEPGVGQNCLVRSSDFSYSHQKNEAQIHHPSIYTFLNKATQSSYQHQDNDVTKSYIKRNLPPLEFEYSVPEIQDRVEDVASDSLKNLPAGVDGSHYQWLDLDNEGIPGILTEQAGSWWYKRNISPVSEQAVEFSAMEQVSRKPNMSLASGASFMDLDGNGQLDLVMLNGASPGYYEHDHKESWQSFKPFVSGLNRTTEDPNMRFLDLDGDGYADVLISEEGAFIWHQSLAQAGFGPARRVSHKLDEESSPRLVFADGSHSIFLADMSGDGLTDLVRIRNGEVCYWPNLGYCRFGAKITMADAPHFDLPEQFEQRRLRLADIDGSGTIDLIYLHTEGVRLYFNQSGNSWSEAKILRVQPKVDEITSITTVDLLGNGTACLLWSSPLPGNSQHQMRYVNLMGDSKPHLLIKTKNNLGAETEMFYAPSTKFYLQDKAAGKPWVTKLPFPVHVVEKVIVTDKWSGTCFATNYSYHHGYFDGVEREFRGFGRVEQLDTESYGKFAEANSNSPYISDDLTLYQPPIKTVTWYHTGAMFEHEKILAHYKHEYFPQWLEDENPAASNISGNFHEAELAEPELPKPELLEQEFKQQNLSAAETREALRACKGMVLRQEVYELAVDELAKGKHKPVKLFSSAYHSGHIQCLQAQGINQHAVFLVTECEAISYQYELSLQTETLTPDPRITHSFNLNIDELGNVLQAVSVVYPRRGKHQDDSLDQQTIQLIDDVQQETHIAYSENHLTNDIKTPDTYRLRVSCEALSYELTGLSPVDDYFTLEEIQQFRLSLDYQNSGQVVTEIEYQQIANNTSPQKRIVEHSKLLYFDDKDRAEPEFLKNPLPFKEQGNLGLPYETYTLALTESLLDAVLLEKHTATIKVELNNAAKSGYIKGTAIGATIDQYWSRSGIAGFANDADEHFFLPERYIDPFNKTTRLNFDPLDLFIQSSTDPIGNATSANKFDYRVLAPRELQDSNDNVTEVVFDVLGLPAAIALKGKQQQQGEGEWQGDNVDDFNNNDLLLNPDPSDIVDFCTSKTQDNDQARQWLGNASTRFIYHFGETLDVQGKEIWATRMSGACSITREQHNNQTTPLQIALECSDGSGNVLMQKVQAEPDPVSGNPRWLINGLTLLNNKGNPVKQYEPAFTDGFACELPQEDGVSSVIYYDAAGQVIRTELPDGSYSKVSYSPWHVSSYDANDTAFDSDQSEQSDWYQRRTNSAHPEFSDFATPENKRAAELTKQHANTPTQVFLDSLGRDVISIEDNITEKYITYSKLDAEGKPLWIRDARGNLVMQYIAPPKANNALDNTMPIDSVPCYDIAGNLLFQHSMDGGDRWMINDAAGQSFYAWDNNENAGGVLQERIYHTIYDELRRPLEQKLQINNQQFVIERLVYGESQADSKSQNLRGQLYQHYDSSGLVTSEAFDFKGNLIETKRQLTGFQQDTITDWSTTVDLDEVYIQKTRYDALNRMTHQENWHINGRQPAIYKPEYNERGLLVSETLTVQGIITEAIRDIEYDAKGQRQRIEYGNGTSTRYFYDDESFRLKQLRTTKTSPGEALPTEPTNLSNDNVLQNLYYSYDPVGNITEIRDDAYEPVFFNNQQVEPRSQYSYDALYRLIQASGRENSNAPATPPNAGKLAEMLQKQFPVTDQTLRNYTQHYSYDSVGNIQEMNHQASGGNWTRHYKYHEDSNRLEKTWQGSDDSNAIIYHYDTHGSMLNLNNTIDEYQLQWDSDDMIQHINLAGGGDVFYDYGSDKERSRKRIINDTGRVIEERLYLGGMERYQKWLNGDLIEEIETYHLFDGEQHLLMVEHVFKSNSEVLPEDVTLFKYQYSNHLGSVGLEVNEEGAVISYEEYHPYGTTAYSVRDSLLKATRKRYRYTGMERDEESGLSYHSARYYLPWLGRWGSADPAGLVDGGNLYGYVRGSSILRRDINGQDSREMNDYITGKWELTNEKNQPKKFPRDGVLHTAINPDEIIDTIGQVLDQEKGIDYFNEYFKGKNKQRLQEKLGNFLREPVDAPLQYKGEIEDQHRPLQYFGLRHPFYSHGDNDELKVSADMSIFFVIDEINKSNGAASGQYGVTKSRGRNSGTTKKDGTWSFLGNVGGKDGASSSVGYTSPETSKTVGADQNDAITKSKSISEDSFDVIVAITLTIKIDKDDFKYNEDDKWNEYSIVIYSRATLTSPPRVVSRGRFDFMNDYLEKSSPDLTLIDIKKWKKGPVIKKLKITY